MKDLYPENYTTLTVVLYSKYFVLYSKYFPWGDNVNALNLQVIHKILLNLPIYFTIICSTSCHLSILSDFSLLVHIHVHLHIIVPVIRPDLLTGSCFKNAIAFKQRIRTFTWKTFKSKYFYINSYLIGWESIQK